MMICLRRRCSFASALLLAAGLTKMAAADVLETQSNPVPDGKIQVVAGDADRSDWTGVPWYGADEQDDAEPLDITRVQVANDSTYVYFHVQLSKWDAPEAWRLGTFFDVDQDSTTGFNGGFPYPIGAEFLNEGPDLYEFTGAGQSDWSWNPAQSGMNRDQPANMVDVELAIPRSSLDTDAFNFIMLANNEFEVGGPLDFYPATANSATGDYLAYSLGQAVLTGDVNGDGAINALDIDALSAAIRAGNTGGQYDLNGDNKVNDDDRTVWVDQMKHTYFGDANLDGQFDSDDFVQVFVAGEYEDDVPLNSTWAGGDWNGDGDFTSADFVTAFVSGGYELGPRAAQAVPEPTTAIGWCSALVICGLSCRRQTAAK